MKRFFALVLMAGFSCCLHAQVVDTTVCAILKDPASFNGKMVRVTGTVVANLDQFVIKGDGCGQLVSDIWLSYPEGTKGKAGPAVMVRVQPAQNFAGTVAAVTRTPVTLDRKDKVFKKFDAQVAAPFTRGGMCLGCNRYAVTATLVGRLDGVTNAALTRDAAGKITGVGGFGNMNAYNARLVLQSVSDVTAKEVDYTKALAETKDDPETDVGTGDALADARKLADLYTKTDPSNASAIQLQRAVDAFKDNVSNGVVIANGAGNEAAASDEAKGTKDSPDGLLFVCTFNTGRVSGDAKTRALVLAGENVANLRTPIEGTAGAPLFLTDYRALVSTTLSAIVSRQKTLTLPGGYVLWNTAWPQGDVNQKMLDAASSYLSNEEMLSK